MGNLYIIRGLPGSGKTTLARTLSERYGCAYYEADQYFEQDGEYRFDPKFLHRAHRECFTKTMADLQEGNDVIVSNTFTTLKEMRDYIDCATEDGHMVHVIHCEGEYGSIHNVPDASIKRMRDRWLDNKKLAEIYNEGISICTW
jgi:predicted kinase